MTEQDYLILFDNDETSEIKPLDAGEFRILGVTADEWNALPAGARYNLIANADDRSLRLETNEEG